MGKNLAILISALALSAAAMAQTTSGSSSTKPDIPMSTSPPSQGSTSNASNPATNAGDQGQGTNDSAQPKKKHHKKSSSNAAGPTNSTDAPNGQTGSNRNNGVNGS